MVARIERMVRGLEAPAGGRGADRYSAGSPLLLSTTVVFGRAGAESDLWGLADEPAADQSIAHRGRAF